MKTKKTFIRAFSFVLVLATLMTIMPLTASAIALSQDTSLTVSNPSNSMTVYADWNDTLVDRYAKYDASTVNKRLKIGLSFTYTQNDTHDPSSSGYHGRVFPVYVSSAGSLFIQSDATYLEKDTYIALYSDAACQTRVSSVSAPRLTGKSAKGYISVPQAGTYYLEIESYSGSQAFTNSIDMDITFYSSKNINILKNKTYYIGTCSSERYFKFTVPSLTNVTFTSSTYVSFDLCDSSKKVKYDYQSFTEDNKFKVSWRLSKGTYYIKTTSTYNENGYFSLQYATSADPTLKSGSFRTIYPGESDNAAYFKFKPTVSGYISVTFKYADNYDYSGYVRLCNSSKKALSNDMYVNANSSTSKKAIFGVEKGKTYYLRVTSLSYISAVKCTQQSVSEKSGNSIKTAKTLKKNTVVKGTITAGSSRADFYKITLTKAQKLKYTCTGYSSGSIGVGVYKSNGKNALYDSTAIYDSSGGGAEFTSYDKLPKGTYYIKVFRNNAKSSGYYTLKWK